MMKKSEIKNTFTHYGLMYGVVPIYVNMNNPEAPDVAVRNFVPEFALDFVDLLFSLFVCSYQLIIDRSYEPMLMIKLTGKIK